MRWWERNNLRLIQNNLREIDADLDVDRLIEQIKEFNANTLMLNTGGIVAFYPTELEYHYISPYLKKDMIGEAVMKCHENGIRFFARFDLSKAHESIYERHPEWFYKSPKGEIINYNGMVHTCVNGYYQREYSLKIIDEVLEKYTVDGIFFNMFGYKTTDYSGNYYGICHCDSCKARFREMYGLDLPSKEDNSDLVYQKYEEFKLITVKEMLGSISKLVKSKQRDIAISTYTDYCVDVIRKESNTEIHRPYPLWLYSSSENIKSVEDTWKDKIVSNCSINAAGLDYRFMGVSEYNVAVRLYESIASGSGLDFCIIGTFDGYPDRENFDIVKKIFRFHSENEKYFGRFHSVSDILIVKPDRYAVKEQEMEYLGIFKMLKEEHAIFDSTCQKNIVNKLKSRHRYKTVIIPDISTFDKEQMEVLRDVAKQGTSIIATNLSFTGTSGCEDFLFEVFGAHHIQKETNSRWAYLDTSEGRSIFKSCSNRDWVMLDGCFSRMEYVNAGKYLRFISPGMFGPPEKCFGNEKTEYFGAGIKKNGSTAGIYVPWQPGFLYQKYGYEAHKMLFMDLVDYSMNGKKVMETDAPMNVEVLLNKFDESGTEGNVMETGGYILQLLNLSGYNGMTFFKPNAISDFNVTLKGIGCPKRVYSLVNKGNIAFDAKENDVVIEIDKLGEYDAFIIE